MAIQKLDTNEIENVVKLFSESTKCFNEQMQNVERATTKLLSEWEGKGRNTFESKYTVFSKQVEDMNEFFVDLYNMLIDAQLEYMDADDKLGKAMKE